MLIFIRFMQELLYPGWSSEFPSPTIVQTIIESSYHYPKPLSVAELLPKDRFLPRLLLPPRHPCFPSLALLHGILAATLVHLDSEAFGLSSLTMYQNYKTIKGGTPAAYHASQIQSKSMEAIAQGRVSVEIGQAAFLALYYYEHAGWRVSLFFLRETGAYS